MAFMRVGTVRYVRADVGEVTSLGAVRLSAVLTVTFVLFVARIRAVGIIAEIWIDIAGEFAG